MKEIIKSLVVNNITVIKVWSEFLLLLFNVSEEWTGLSNLQIKTNFLGLFTLIWIDKKIYLSFLGLFLIRRQKCFCNELCKIYIVIEWFHILQ